MNQPAPAHGQSRGQGDLQAARGHGRMRRRPSAQSRTVADARGRLVQGPIRGGLVRVGAQPVGQGGVRAAAPWLGDRSVCNAVKAA